MWNSDRANSDDILAVSRDRPLRVAILTEDEPIFATDDFRAFRSALGTDAEPVLAVLAQYSPAGSKLSRSRTLWYLWRTLGPADILRGAIMYLRCRADPSKHIGRIFKKSKIPVVRTHRDINDRRIVEAIRDAKPDVIVSYTVHGLFDTPLLSIAPCLVLHLSLLPRHAGLMPVFWALHDGDQEAGVTVFRANKQIDGGEILDQRRIAIGARRLVPLYRDLKRLGMMALADAVRQVGRLSGVPASAELSTEPVNRKPGPEQFKAFRAAGNRIF